MPAYVVEKVSHALNTDRKPLNGSKILVLGVAYKRDINDVRESPALDVIHLLEERGATVTYHDPFVPSIREDGEVRDGTDLTPAGIAAMDAVVVVTDHKNVDYQMVMNNAVLIIDSRNVTRGLVQTKARVVSLASGAIADADAAHAI